MNTTIKEIDIDQKLNELNISLSGGLTFMPEHIEKIKSRDDLVFAESLTQLRKLFKANGVEFATLGFDDSRFRARKSAELFLPGLFISLSLLSENPTVISVALSVLANYVTEFFKGKVGAKNASIEIYIEKTNEKKVTQISYNGDAEGIKNLENIIKNLK